MRDGMRWPRAVVAGCLVAAVACLPSPTAQAGFSATGTWQATLTLSVYPCPADPTCAGSLSGSLVGTAAGLDAQGHPFMVIWPDPTSTAQVNQLSVTLPPPNLSATFLYTQSCPIGLADSATGGFTLSGGYVDDNGVISHNGTMTGTIGWTRLGVVLIVGTSSGVVTGGGATLATQQTIGNGVGIFVPQGVATCANVQTITAQIAGGYETPL